MVKIRDDQSDVRVISISGPPLPVDLEFKPVPAAEAFKAHGLSFGRSFGSKSAYAAAHPKAEAIFNANVFTGKQGKVWWGDLDLARDKPVLEKVARKIRCRLYVVREHDGRFENADQTHAEVVKVAVWYTGGRSLVRDRRGFLKRSGLSPTEVSILLKLKRGQFDQRQEPSVALEIGRRMRKMEEAFVPIASADGHKKWGYWWTKPNRNLAGRSPLSVLKSGESIDLCDLTEPTFGMVLFAMSYSHMEII